MKKTIKRMLCMCPASWYIFMGSIRLCCFMLLGAMLLLIVWNGSMYQNYELYMTALSIIESTQGVLLAAVLFSVLIEERHS